MINRYAYRYLTRTVVAGIAGATEQSPLASVTAATPGLQQPRETAPERGLEAHPLLKRPLWRENGARETLLYVIAARTCLPARKGRRSIGSRRDSVRERPFGVETAPKLRFPTGFRTREALRRRNGAEAWVPATLAARTGPPASESRRKARCANFTIPLLVL